jgi:ketosteroid isomerase-like protein
MPNLDTPVITRYFEADVRRDIDAIVALFTDEAVVVDEGQTYHGSAQIRGWQEGAASRYRYTTEVFDTQRTGEESYLVTGRLTGNFPGGTAELKWRFTVHGDLISHSEQNGLLWKSNLLP